MGPEGEAYVRWFHERNVWKAMTWHGIRTLKLPSDIWNYQEIMFERRIEHVIETGTRHGGSAVFFAETLAARRAPGPVVSIDANPVRPEHGPGPWEAIEQYLAEAPGLLVHDAAREAKFGATFAVRGYYTRA